MILAIAIIALCSFIIKVIINAISLSVGKEIEQIALIDATITVLAWWNICLPFAITFLVISVILILITIFTDP